MLSWKSYIRDKCLPILVFTQRLLCQRHLLPNFLVGVRLRLPRRRWVAFEALAVPLCFGRLAGAGAGTAVSALLASGYTGTASSNATEEWTVPGATKTLSVS